MDQHNLICLNTQYPTYYRVSDQTTSNIDLSIISTTRSLTYTWTTLSDLHGSDHFPIILKSHTHHLSEKPLRWNLKLADWPKFSKLSETISKVSDFTDIDEAYNHLTTKIIKAAQESVPIKKPPQNKPPVPWWTKNCQQEKRKTRSAFRRMRKKTTITNIIIYKRRQAIKRRIYKEARRQSWINYI